MNKGHIFLICGPSGVGKSSTIKFLLEDNPNFILIPSYTTRAARLDDKETHSRIHISRENFETLIAENAFVEWVEYAHHLYGKKKADILDVLNQNKTILIDVDVNGLIPYSQQFPNSTSILMRYRSLDDLKARIRKARPDISEEQINHRYNLANTEMTAFEKFKFDYTVTTYNDQSPKISGQKVKTIIDSVLAKQPNI